MKEPTWEKCHYYDSGRCPQRSAIDKAYLIPQLLDISEIKAAAETCEQCKHQRNEKRKHRRVARPLRVVVNSRKAKSSTKGTIIDISVKGALVKLDNWINFDKGEKVDIELYYNKRLFDQEKANVINVSAQVKRVAKEKQMLAITFIDDTQMKKCANI